MSLYLYRLRYSIRVLRRLVREEFEERSRTEEDRDRPIRREGLGNHKLLLQLFNQVVQSRNHKGGVFNLSALKAAVLVHQSVIIVNMFLFL